RAIGETMIVTMAAGLAARLTLNPLDTATTVTVQIVTLLTGDQEFDSPKTLAAFGLGLTLFLVTLGLNVVAQRIVHTYRRRSDGPGLAPRSAGRRRSRARRPPARGAEAALRPRGAVPPVRPAGHRPGGGLPAAAAGPHFRTGPH